MIFREGVVRDNRGLSTTPAFAWQILKNETHVYFCRDICEDIRYRNIRGVSFFVIFI